MQNDSDRKGPLFDDLLSMRALRYWLVRDLEQLDEKIAKLTGEPKRQTLFVMPKPGKEPRSGNHQSA